MNRNPLLTVYITNYNYGKYIKQSIESVLVQTFQDFELFIIDDGSVDDSKEIIEQYRDNPKINIIYQQNKGLNVTNNIAMRASVAKYIMRLDADDFLTPDALEIMVSTLENDTDLGLVFPDYYYTNDDGIITGEEIRHDFDKDVSLFDQPAHGACTMIRLENLRMLGGYNESFTCQDGYDLWIKFIMHYKVSNINKPLFFYRRHGNNLTGNEERILSTRKKIKETYVESFKLITPKTVAIIPVRNTFINKINWPLYKNSNHNTILELALEKLENSKKIDWIVVTSSDTEILDFIESKKTNFSKLFIIKRPFQLSKSGETLNNTFNFILDTLFQKQIYPEALLSFSLDYPFVTTDIVDDAINTLTIFKADSLISVRLDNKMYFQHTGHGLIPILEQDKFTRLEREALYKGQGGIMLSKVDNFKKNGKILTGKIGHIIVDEKVSFGVFTEWDFYVFKAIIKN
ncbi:glycosyltransferase [Flavobacterium cyclinae]|uniref:glycosyltransferase n=1 Tax=Flavobacterium cyclinae TaxID=2895947 RepID=UPI001E42B00C|nr:glycosyltransferase [Flavobacterium cyclinae]UGS20602.1 glycosyltransferase [Flavobacterium cyclinae]